MKNTINLAELKNLLNYFIDNNRRLKDEGKKPISINIESDAGIGKTSVVEQVAQERGMTYIKLNLAQLEEAGDLIGFPVKEYEVKSKEGKIQWISADLLKYYLELGYEATGEQQMGYATPKWLPKDDNPNGVILCLDDYSRR